MGLKFLSTQFKAFLDDESGATAIEYALIIALLGAGLVTTMGRMGNGVNNNLLVLGNTIERQDINTGHVDD
ncbi:MAG: Flp family type IVb pilin [Maricaulaceae bacterium]